MGYYTDKVAIVTGGASGLGLALCEALAQQGAVVVPVDIDTDGAQRVAAAIEAAGGKAVFGYLDVSLFENDRRIVNDIVNKFGRIDLLFNNAGTALQGETRDLTVEHWRRVLDVNLMGVIYGAISAYDVMVRQGFGQIVNIGSLAGLIPVPKEIPYCTSKWAVVGFSNALRVEGADLGIKVNVVCPGLMHTPIHQRTPAVNVDPAKMRPDPALKFSIEPERAATIILDGVAKNRGIIIFPLYARLIWWAYRLHPGLFHRLFQKMIRDFRKQRLSS